MKMFVTPETGSSSTPGTAQSRLVSRRSFLSSMALGPVAFLLLPAALNQGTQPALAAAPPEGSLPAEPSAPAGAGRLTPAASRNAPESAIVRRQAIVRVLEDAQASGNMPGAIEKFGKSLTPEEKRILLSIPPHELAALRSARRKLKLTAAP